jgi:hypothetical protein
MPVLPCSLIHPRAGGLLADRVHIGARTSSVPPVLSPTRP